MNKKILLIAAVIGVIALSTTVFARGHGRGYDGRGEGGYGRGGCGNCSGSSSGYGMMGGQYGRGTMMGDGYGPRGYNGAPLTAEAIEKIRAIDQKYYPQIEKIRADIYAQNAVIRAEMVQANPDKAKITKAMDEKSKLDLTLDKLNLDRMLEIRNVK